MCVVCSVAVGAMAANPQCRAPAAFAALWLSCVALVAVSPVLAATPVACVTMPAISDSGEYIMVGCAAVSMIDVTASDVHLTVKATEMNGQVKLRGNLSNVAVFLVGCTARFADSNALVEVTHTIDNVTVEVADTALGDGLVAYAGDGAAIAAVSIDAPSARVTNATVRVHNCTAKLNATLASVHVVKLQAGADVHIEVRDVDGWLDSAAHNVTGVALGPSNTSMANVTVAVHGFTAALRVNASDTWNATTPRETVANVFAMREVPAAVRDLHVAVTNSVFDAVAPRAFALQFFSTTTDDGSCTVRNLTLRSSAYYTSGALDVNKATTNHMRFVMDDVHSEALPWLASTGHFMSIVHLEWVAWNGATLTASGCTGLLKSIGARYFKARASTITLSTISIAGYDVTVEAAHANVVFLDYSSLLNSVVDIRDSTFALDEAGTSGTGTISPLYLFQCPQVRGNTLRMTNVTVDMKSNDNLIVVVYSDRDMSNSSIGFHDCSFNETTSSSNGHGLVRFAARPHVDVAVIAERTFFGGVFDGIATVSVIGAYTTARLIRCSVTFINCTVDITGGPTSRSRLVNMNQWGGEVLFTTDSTFSYSGGSYYSSTGYTSAAIHFTTQAVHNGLTFNLTDAVFFIHAGSTARIVSAFEANVALKDVSVFAHNCTLTTRSNGGEATIFSSYAATNVRFAATASRLSTFSMDHNAANSKQAIISAFNDYAVEGSDFSLTDCDLQARRTYPQNGGQPTGLLDLGRAFNNSNVTLLRCTFRITSGGHARLLAATALPNATVGPAITFDDVSGTMETNNSAMASVVESPDATMSATTVIMRNTRIACVADALCGQWVDGFVSASDTVFSLRGAKFINFNESQAGGTAQCHVACSSVNGNPLTQGTMPLCTALTSTFRTTPCRTATPSASWTTTVSRSVPTTTLTTTASATPSRSAITATVTDTPPRTGTSSPTHPTQTTTVSATATSTIGTPSAAATVSPTRSASASRTATRPPTLTVTLSVTRSGATTRTLTDVPTPTATAVPLRATSTVTRTSTVSFTPTATVLDAARTRTRTPLRRSATSTSTWRPAATATIQGPAASAVPRAPTLTPTPPGPSRTATLPLPPKPSPVLPRAVAQVVETAAAVTSLTAGGSPGVALQVARSLEILALVQYCELAGAQREAALAEPIGFPRSALPMLAVGDRVGQYHRGTIIGNVLIAPAIFPVMIAIGVALMRWVDFARPRSVKIAPEWLAGTFVSQSLRATRMPSLLGVGYGFLVAGSVSSAAVLAIGPQTERRSPTDVLLLIFAFLSAVVPLAIFQYVTQRVAAGGTVASMPVTIVHRDTDVPTLSRGTAQRSLSENLVRYFLLGETHWFPIAPEVRAGSNPGAPGGPSRISIEAHVEALQQLEQFGLFFVRYRVSDSPVVGAVLRHFFAFEALSTIAIALAQGMAIDTCEGAAWLVLTVSTVMLLATCVLRPYVVPAKNALAIVVALATWASAGVATAASSKAVSSEGMAHIAARLAAAASLAAIASMVLTVGRLLLLRLQHARLAPSHTAASDPAETPMLGRKTTPVQVAAPRDAPSTAAFLPPSVPVSQPTAGHETLSDFLDTDDDEADAGGQAAPSGLLLPMPDDDRACFYNASRASVFRTSEGQQRYEEIEQALNHGLAAAPRPTQQSFAPPPPPPPVGDAALLDDLLGRADDDDDLSLDLDDL